MGATAFYHELFIETMGGYEKLVVDEVLPNTTSRVALYQYPFLGFQKYSDGRYEYRGLYTIGPDKGDKKTFGYNETERYPNLMMIEGPNHDPYLTRFLIPWTSDVFYDYANETLSVGEDGGIKEEGWDADAIADFDPASSGDAQAIMNLFLSEFKPAYDAVYYNSPYIASLEESGWTLEEINANISAFQKAKTREHDNKLMTFYNENYELIYYRVKTGQYEVLPKETHDMLTYLGLSGTPSTQDILNARAAQWTEKVSEYININEAYYHQCFCELLGISDNEAKNTYWRKFKSIENGGKWGFQQDDLDTIFQNDNNGQDTKDYFVEPDDLNENGGDIFQGRTSAFWYALRQHSKSELRVMMRNLVNKALVLAGKYKISAGTVHQSLFNLIGYYFWSKSSKYFPATAYNEDTRWTYIDIWYPNPDSTYNGVPPLTQIHGDHYETEREWVEKRIAYIFSKYQIGAFEAQSADGYGSLEFTAANDFTMNITPAIALYPRTSKGGAVTEPSDRTMAGEVYPMVMTGSGDTARYLKGVDWLSDIGDCSGLTLASRGGATEIAFTVKGKRLRRLKVGDENPDNVKFNATRIAVSGEAIEDIDARNASSIQGSLNLSECPRLRTADFTGTNLAVILPPVGGRMRYLALPKSLSTLFLHNLNLLEAENLVLEDGKNINLLYFNTCSNLEPLTLLRRLVETPENKLQGISMIFTEPITDTDPKNMEMLADLVRNIGPDGYFLVSYSDGTLIPDTNKAPDISGKIITDYPIYEDSVQLIEEKLVNLDVVYNPEKVCIRFADDEVKRILSTKYGYVDEETGEPFGMTQAQADKVTTLGTIFRANTNITSFDEFERFTSVKEVGSTNPSNSSSPFYSCTNLQSIKFPVNTERIGYTAFDGCTSLRGDISLPNLKWMNFRSFANSGIDSVSNLGNLDKIYENSFVDCTNLKSITLPSSLSKIERYAFSGCISLENLYGMEQITSLGECALKKNSLRVINMPQLEGTLSLGEFQGSQIEEVISLGKVTAIATGGQASYNSTFGECKKLKRVILPKTLHTVGKYAFQACSELEYVNLEEIQDSIIKLDQSCFSGCTKLSFDTLSFPNLTVFASEVFQGKNINQLLNLGTIGDIPNNSLRDCKTLTKVVLPESCYRLGENAFHSDSSLVDLNLSGNESIQIIAASALAGCTSLEIDDLKLPNLTSLGWACLDGVKITKISDLGSITVFPRCLRSSQVQTTIKEVILPDTCTEIHAEAFGGITSLEKVVLPEGIITLGNNHTFNNCSNLSDINLPTSIETIGGYSFGGCSKMKNSIYLPNLKSYGGYDGAHMFNGAGITEVLSLGHLTVLPWAIFANCINLTKVILPEKMTTLNGGAFEGATKLETLVLYSTIPPTFGRAGFGTTAIAKGAGFIYVPDGSIEAYKTAAEWNNYAAQIKGHSEYDGELPDLPNYTPRIVITAEDGTHYRGSFVQIPVEVKYYYGDVVWSLIAGDDFAEIDQTGKVIIKEGALNSSITVRCEAVDGSLFDEVTILLTYETTYRVDITSLLEEGIYYLTNVSVGSKFLYETYTPSTTFKSTVYDLPSDANALYIIGKGGTAPRMYCFLDKDDVVLDVAADMLSLTTETKIPIPENSVRVILNINKTVTPNSVIVAKDIE